MSQSQQLLNTRLQAILPGAQLEVMSLPEAPEIRLLLLEQGYPQGDLGPAQMQRVMDNPLYWIFCWASGQVLARYILDNPAWVKGKRVVDFGCGSGVVAVAAALAGAREVIACDVDTLALEATRFNARLNNVSLTLSDNYFDIGGTIDRVIVADVLYDRENFIWLQRFLDRAPRVLVADSRVKDFNHPPYRLVEQRESYTMPDLDESAEFREVRIYRADRD